MLFASAAAVEMGFHLMARRLIVTAFVYTWNSFLASAARSPFESDEVVGAFACYDWASNYTFITGRNDHVAILRASAR